MGTLLLTIEAFSYIGKLHNRMSTSTGCKQRSSPERNKTPTVSKSFPPFFPSKIRKKNHNDKRLSITPQNCKEFGDQEVLGAKKTLWFFPYKGEILKAPDERISPQQLWVAKLAGQHHIMWRPKLESACFKGLKRHVMGSFLSYFLLFCKAFFGRKRSHQVTDSSCSNYIFEMLLHCCTFYSKSQKMSTNFLCTNLWRHFLH